MTRAEYRERKTPLFSRRNLIPSVFSVKDRDPCNVSTLCCTRQPERSRQVVLLSNVATPDFNLTKDFNRLVWLGVIGKCFSLSIKYR